jgi:hypothetical protein
MSRWYTDFQLAGSRMWTAICNSTVGRIGLLRNQHRTNSQCYPWLERKKPHIIVSHTNLIRCIQATQIDKVHCIITDCQSATNCLKYFEKEKTVNLILPKGFSHGSLAPYTYRWIQYCQKLLTVAVGRLLLQFRWFLLYWILVWRLK